LPGVQRGNFVFGAQWEGGEKEVNPQEKDTPFYFIKEKGNSEEKVLSARKAKAFGVKKGGKRPLTERGLLLKKGKGRKYKAEGGKEHRVLGVKGAAIYHWRGGEETTQTERKEGGIYHTRRQNTR